MTAFVEACHDPVVIEPGEEPIPLVEGSYHLEEHNGRLTLQAWDSTRNLVRRIHGVSTRKPGRVELAVERFGKKTGTLLVFDRGRGGNISVERRAVRMVLRERFRRFLSRQFTGWRIAELTTEADLEHSLSPAYPRALLTRGGSGWAALASPDEAASADAALTYGLIWLDYLRRRERRVLVEGLCLLLPTGREMATCLRSTWLNPNAARLVVFAYDGPDWEAQAGPGAFGNLDTRVEPVGTPQEPRRLDLPEALLEAQLRRKIQHLDAELLPSPVYGQVPAWTGVERGILDLLACDRRGRLAVLELKASPDPHLPMQALDYWLRVRWHHTQGDFVRQGYFPVVPLRAQPPRLLLVAPALAWHSSTETVLRYFAREVEVERFGVAVEWQREIRVLFRLRGSRAPD